MSKLDKKPMQQAQLSKNSHDLSHTFDFTSSTGMILPLEHDLLNPGESIECKIDLSQTRTMPLQAAAYLDLDLHVDYFFVPMTILFGPFEAFIYRINDYYSSSQTSYINLPLFNLQSFKDSVHSLASYAASPVYPATKNFDQLGKGCLRLLEHFGFGNLETGTKNYNPSIFPYQLLAYNAIYQYYFRNDEYEDFDNSAFNVDDPSYGGVIPTNNHSFPMFCLQYRDKYHDYFTSIKASPIVSGKNLIDSAGSLSLAKSWLSREKSSSEDVSTFNTLGAGVRGVDSSAFSGAPGYFNSDNGTRLNFGFSSREGSPDHLSANSFPNGADINTANLRALFANEKLWTITGMNRKQYDAQTLAHFGFDVPTDVMHQVQHLGHHLFNVSVGEVISTSGTTAQPLATVAGKGYAFENNDEPIRFTAPCHGVFMAVYSSAIRRNYFNNFRKENAVATWQDFYQPEFDHLGMQPMFLFETMQTDYISNPKTVSETPFGTIIGWQYRYEQFKRRYDSATPAFSYLWLNNGEALNSTYGPFSSWSATDQAFEGNDLEAMAFNPSVALRWCLKESPVELNTLMAVAYDPAWYENETLNYLHRPDLSFATDPLVHHALIHYKKLSTMSNYSLPKLD